MTQTRFQEFVISQLVLGTAQFGLDYGVANRVGKPPPGVVRNILAKAFENGVNALDTASVYGDSEVVLGRMLRDLGARDRVFVVTKVPPMEGRVEPGEAARFIESAVAGSLSRLSLDFLPLCLLHGARDLPYLDALLRLREKGWIRHAGISVYTPEQALQAIHTPGIEAIQHPTSLLDQRFLHQGVLREAQQNGVSLFVRSVYLQGLFFVPEPQIPPELASVKPLRKRLLALADSCQITLAELALRFAISQPEVKGVVVGMETVNQLELNLQFFSRGPLTLKVLERIHSLVPETPETILNPSQWPRRF